MALGAEIGWAVRPQSFKPEQTTTAAAVYFGGTGASDANLDCLRSRAVPILPVVSDLARVREEIPEVLRPLNCLDYRHKPCARPG